MVNPCVEIKTIIHVALAADERYYPGLLACVVSILHSSRAGDFRFWVFDGGLSPESWAELRALRQRFRNIVAIEPLSFDADHFKNCRPIYHGSHLAYARLLLPDCLDADQVIYLDSDMLVLRPLEELWQLEIGSDSIAAVRDICMMSLAEDCPFEKNVEYLKGTPYFNSGLMLINLKSWRRNGIFQKAMECMDHYPNVKFWDQTVLNYLLQGRVYLLDQSWNTLAGRIGEADFGTDLHHVLHYTTKTKPWMACLYKNGAAHLFHKYWQAVVQPGENPVRAFGLRKSLYINTLRYASPAATILYLRFKLLLIKPERRMPVLRAIVQWRGVARKRSWTNSRYRTACRRTAIWEKQWRTE